MDAMREEGGKEGEEEEGESRGPKSMFCVLWSVVYIGDRISQQICRASCFHGRGKYPSLSLSLCLSLSISLSLCLSLSISLSLFVCLSLSLYIYIYD